MSATFVDTSALVALLDEAEQGHKSAVACWADLIDRDVTLLTTNYVLTETAAVLQRRVGLNAVQVVHRDFTPILQIEWVDEPLHMLGMDSALLAGRRKLSLVDCVSFLVMRRHHVRTAFTFDDHFREQGFTVLP